MIVEKSSAAGAVLRSSPLVQARYDMAMARLRADITRELFILGATVSEDNITKIIAGLSGDTLAIELAKRM